MKSAIEKGFYYVTILEKKKEDLRPALYNRYICLGISYHCGIIYSGPFRIHVYGFSNAGKRHHENALSMDTQRFLLAEFLARHKGK
jgi:hypothetical protein